MTEVIPDYFSKAEIKAMEKKRAAEEAAKKRKPKGVRAAIIKAEKAKKN
ncbi:MAG: hypothetical protein J5703_06415 [Methanomicrobium sp.]|nr:hypothetical protein [Methanomicrobium sp.]